jgi:hypothetical protein
MSLYFIFFLLTIVLLALLQFSVDGYPFDIFKLSELVTYQEKTARLKMFINKDKQTYS